MNATSTLALIGGGPAALFMLKQVYDKKLQFKKIIIFERNDRFGVGMPYGKFGSKEEHVANVSANELPKLFESFSDYIKRKPDQGFQNFVKGGNINEYEVIPRLLLGNYLEEQFKIYSSELIKQGIELQLLLNTEVKDIKYSDNIFNIITDNDTFTSDYTVICIGHLWKKTFEDKIENWYDSPYPPSKFTGKNNYPVAIRGASLTAVDAIKTISRNNGIYKEDENGNLEYIVSNESPNFKIHLYSLSGFLPALRFHTEDEAFDTNWTMNNEEINDYKNKNNGFVDLDYVFKKNFIERVKEKDYKFYDRIKDLSIEQFVDEMLKIRNELDSFTLLKAEFTEAEKSIERHQSIVWKEILSAFSYAVNYPAKHFPAEDMLRLKGKLMPLISIIIASLPQSSYYEIMALYNANILEVISVGKDSDVVPNENYGAIYKIKDDNGSREIKYDMFVDAIGQKPMNYGDFPFESVKNEQLISRGFLYFKNNDIAEEEIQNGNQNVKQDSTGKYYLLVTGLSIGDNFEKKDIYAVSNKKFYNMSVPFIGGLNPDYSGMDFCDTASERIVNSILDDFNDAATAV